MILSSGCTNIGSTAGSPGSEISIGSDTNEGADGGAFRLQTVVPTPGATGTSYDLIGQDNQFDVYCSGSYGVCKCEYSYQLSDGTSQIVDGDVTYQESDLLRCINTVPSGIASFDAKVVVVSASGTTTGTTSGGTTTSGTESPGYTSNSIHVDLGDGSFSSDAYLDLSNAQSYVAVDRFQCRRREFIPNPLDPNIIDPIQSEDPKIIYPFNFYTTNLSQSLLQMQQQGTQNWECTLTATQDRSLHWWANPYVYSSSPCTDAFCAGDGELMDPTDTLSSGPVPVTNSAATGKRRASFSVASRPYGVFQIPIKAAVAPNNYVSSSYAVIGYGAKPIPNVNGSSSCPNIPLPSKAIWVKLWNFRATDITPPSYVSSSNAMRASAIACNPSTGSPVFPSCATKITSAGSGDHRIFGCGLNEPGGITSCASGAVGPLTSLAARVAALTDGGDNPANVCYNIDTSDWFSATPASEKWQPGSFGFNNSLTIDTLKDMPWALYQTLATSCQESTTSPGDGLWRLSTASCDGNGDPTATPTPGIPADTLQSGTDTTPLYTDNFTDQMFVVTDANVSDTSMRNQDLTVSEYRPVTYRSSEDCNSASRANCPSNKELHWDVNVKEVGSTTSADVYPLCVLQFYD